MAANANTSHRSMAVVPKQGDATTAPDELPHCPAPRDITGNLQAQTHADRPLSITFHRYHSHPCSFSASVPLMNASGNGKCPLVSHRLATKSSLICCQFANRSRQSWPKSLQTHWPAVPNALLGMAAEAKLHAKSLLTRPIGHWRPNRMPMPRSPYCRCVVSSGRHWMLRVLLPDAAAQLPLL